MIFVYLFANLLASAAPSHPSRAPSCYEEKTPPVCDRARFKPAPPGSLADVSPLRRAIVEAAQHEIGVVSDAVGKDCSKHGWQHLLEYYRLGRGLQLNPVEMARLKRPQRTKDDITKISEWCGIFAMWAVKKGHQDWIHDRGESGGVSQCQEGDPPTLPGSNVRDLRGPFLYLTRWKDKDGIQGIPAKTIPVAYWKPGVPPEWVEHQRKLREEALHAIQPGDVVIFQGEVRHHAVVERVAGDKIYTIDGNQACQMVTRQERPLDEIDTHYSVESLTTD